MEQTIKYAVTAPKRPGSLVTFEYTLTDQLVSIRFNPDATPGFKQAILLDAPLHVKDLNGKTFEGCEINKVNDVDTTFKTFWETYGYKVGNRSRVEKRWNELLQDDQILALSFIRRYRNWCERKKIEQCYPETYLNQRRWENLID